MLVLKGKYTTAHIMTDDAEEECLTQIKHMIDHPAFSNDVVIMPDTHAGKGSVIGFTMPLGDMVIPNVIGVDIGCGMLTMNLGKELGASLPEIDRKIQSTVPMSTCIHKKKIIGQYDFDFANIEMEHFTRKLNERFGTNFNPREFNESWLTKKMEELDIGNERFHHSVGTLGGGNHFIEIGKCDENYFLTIHSGSRNFGLKVAEYWQKTAIRFLDKPPIIYPNPEASERQAYSKLSKPERKKLKKAKKQKKTIINKDLACLHGNEMFTYLQDMLFAQYYASLNRHTILKLIMDILNWQTEGEIIESVHNFIDVNDLMIRKGAIRSYQSEKIIIPFNMRDGILICEGKSNAEWNFSAPHGAGRIMSRSKAKNTLNIEEYQASMRGIHSSCISKSTIDESPMVYKNARKMEQLIVPTADILFRIKPVLNIKAAE